MKEPTCPACSAPGSIITRSMKDADGRVTGTRKEYIVGWTCGCLSWHSTPEAALAGADRMHVVVIPRTDAKMLADVIQFLADTPGPDVIGPEEAASDLRRALDYHARLIASKIPGAQLEEDTK